MVDLVQKVREVWQGSALCTAPTLQNLVPAVHSVPNGVNVSKPIRTSTSLFTPRKLSDL
jgi:hypothetical protein